MEMSQRYAWYSFLKETKMSFFYFYKTGEQEGRTGSAYGI
jgi:hypothetical protein